MFILIECNEKISKLISKSCQHRSSKTPSFASFTIILPSLMIPIKYIGLIFVFYLEIDKNFCSKKVVILIGLVVYE